MAAPSTDHYFDNAATTRLHPDVLAAMERAFLEDYANPAAIHAAGVRAERLMDEARQQVADAIDAEPGEIVFTSGGTEANNLALRGRLLTPSGPRGQLVTTAVEHSSVLATARFIERCGGAVTVLPVDRWGRVDTDALRASITRETRLLSLGLVNNELGTELDAAALIPAARARAAAVGADLFIHVDAVQALGKRSLSVRALGVDLLTVSAHKIHGPKGVGALFVRRGATLAPLLYGGDQERGWRPGTPNVSGIVGFGQAASDAVTHLDTVTQRLWALRRDLVTALWAAMPDLVINSPVETWCAPHILNVSVPGSRGEFLVHALSREGVSVATGSACTARRASASHVLEAAGLPRASLEAALRISWSEDTTAEDVAALVDGLVQARAALEGIVRPEATGRRAAREREPVRPRTTIVPQHQGRVVLVRYGEIGLKGGNRGYFERLLVSRVQERLTDMDAAVTRSGGRIWIDARSDASAVVERLSTVFGIVSLATAERLPLELAALERAVVAAVADGPAPVDFKIETERPNKRFPLTSIELNRALGRAVQHVWPELPVNVHRPALTVHVEIRDDAAYVWARDRKGPGGLPVGSGGRALCLLSGGFDSPVAAWMTMKRGMQVSAVYFDSPPFTSPQARDKVVALIDQLTRWGGSGRLLIVPFTAIQAAIQRECPERLVITIMRRMMMRIADRVARRERALVLVTGESLGQVASQTPESLTTIASPASLPILRPVIGLDKTEILQRAQTIGTYDVSRLPYQDCCSVFVPRKPAIRPTESDALAAEAVRDWEPLLDEAVRGVEVLRRPPLWHRP